MCSCTDTLLRNAEFFASPFFWPVTTIPLPRPDSERSFHGSNVLYPGRHRASTNTRRSALANPFLLRYAWKPPFFVQTGILPKVVPTRWYSPHGSILPGVPVRANNDELQNNHMFKNRRGRRDQPLKRVFQFACESAETMCANSMLLTTSSLTCESMPGGPGFNGFLHILTTNERQRRAICHLLVSAASLFRGQLTDIKIDLSGPLHCGEPGPHGHEAHSVTSARAKDIVVVSRHSSATPSVASLSPPDASCTQGFPSCTGRAPNRAREKRNDIQTVFPYKD